MFLTDNLENEILFNPAKLSGSACNSLKIVSGFIDCDRISTHLIRLGDGAKEKRYSKNITVEVILGMTKSAGGLTERKHSEIRRLVYFLNTSRDMPNFKCSYICSGKATHSKVYVWSKDDKPVIAFCGSVNYTMNAFNNRRETAVSCSPIEANQYYHSLLPDCVDCYDENALSLVKSFKPNSAIATNGISSFNTPAEILEDGIELDYSYYDKLTPVDELSVSLLKADGSDTGYGSGINWGIRRNGTRRNPNQAYIPYNRPDRKVGFFPDRIHPDDANCPIFKVITKDYGSFYMRMAQQNNKALHSAESNAILGEWIRSKIGVASGGYITKQMLLNYGSTKVKFRKYEDGTYLLDF